MPAVGVAQPRRGENCVISFCRSDAVAGAAWAAFAGGLVLPGQMPAQEATWRALGKAVMSPPVSAGERWSPPNSSAVNHGYGRPLLALLLRPGDLSQPRLYATRAVERSQGAAESMRPWTTTPQRNTVATCGGVERTRAAEHPVGDAP